MGSKNVPNQEDKIKELEDDGWQRTMELRVVRVKSPWHTKGYREVPQQKWKQVTNQLVRKDVDASYTETEIRFQWVDLPVYEEHEINQ